MNSSTPSLTVKPSISVKGFIEQGAVSPFLLDPQGKRDECGVDALIFVLGWHLENKASGSVFEEKEEKTLSDYLAKKKISLKENHLHSLWKFLSRLKTLKEELKDNFLTLTRQLITSKGTHYLYAELNPLARSALAPLTYEETHINEILQPSICLDARDIYDITSALLPQPTSVVFTAQGKFEAYAPLGEPIGKDHPFVYLKLTDTEGHFFVVEIDKKELQSQLEPFLKNNVPPAIEFKIITTQEFSAEEQVLGFCLLLSRLSEENISLENFKTLQKTLGDISSLKLTFYEKIQKLLKEDSFLDSLHQLFLEYVVFICNIGTPVYEVRYLDEFLKALAQKFNLPIHCQPNSEWVLDAWYPKEGEILVLCPTPHPFKSEESAYGVWYYDQRV